MGIYVYKTTAKTVELANGEKASVAIYAYKPIWGVSSNQHVLSGAAACDRNADKRQDWVVLGHKDDAGKITVNRDSVAKRIGKHGSFNDGWFDLAETDTSLPVAAHAGVILEDTKEVMTDDKTGFIVTSHLIKDQWVEISRQSFTKF